MKILIAPDSFKDSLASAEAAEAMRDGLLRAMPDAKTVLLPIGDGGEGTLEALTRTAEERHMNKK